MLALILVGSVTATGDIIMVHTDTVNSQTGTVLNMVAAVYQEGNIWLFQNCGYENHGITDLIPFSFDCLL